MIRATERFYPLDALRGVAALVVVLWHWQHFFYSGTSPGSYEVARMPLYEWLAPFYTHGWLAVDLFFCLSGFVFFCFYSSRIADGRTGAREFALARFSRLYPLHLLTLLIVAAAQLWICSFETSPFVYDIGGRNFALNLFLASSWGFEDGPSFNGPIWSVSVEVMLYCVFFAFCRFLPVRPWLLGLIALLGFGLVQHFYSPIGRGIGSFFMGGCVYLAHRQLSESKHRRVLCRCLFLGVAAAGIGTALLVSRGLNLASFSEYLGETFPHRAMFTAMLSKAALAWPVLVLFPATLLALSLVRGGGAMSGPMRFLGDISYSSYLLHFPLQIVLSQVVLGFGIDASIYYSPWLLAGFLVVLTVASAASFRYLEMPAQKRLRSLRLWRTPLIRSADAA